MPTFQLFCCYFWAPGTPQQIQVPRAGRHLMQRASEANQHENACEGERRGEEGEERRGGERRGEEEEEKR